MTSISNFRHRRNLGDPTVTAVTEFCLGMLTRVRAEIERRIKVLALIIFAISLQGIPVVFVDDAHAGSLSFFMICQSVKFAGRASD
eukprot:2402655-Pleurochrysis_carterae.AAC.7